MTHLIRTACLLLVLSGLPASIAGGADLQALDDAALLQLMAPSEDLRGRCGTPVVLELLSRGLEFETASAAAETLYHLTDDGNFRVAYQREGTVAVDTTDADLSGVPDYVELIGRAFERSWHVEIDSLQFPTVDLQVGERYQVSTLLGSGFYGLTQPNEAAPGGSTIKIHHDIGSLPGVGDEVNATLSTVAHEFKHAVQIASGWNGGDILSVGGWIEVDATWIEDLVYDDSNDFYFFLSSGGSPFTAPDQSLAATPSYQDCTWQHYLSESFGHEFLLEFSERIAASRPGQIAYLDVANARGLDWTELWRDYTVATYLSGARAVEGLGFSEAGDYPTAVVETLPSVPYGPVIQAPLQDMAMRFHHFVVPASGTTGRVELEFAGTIGRDWTVAMVYQRGDDTQVVPVVVTEALGRHVPDLLVEDYETFAVVVGSPGVPPGSVIGSGNYQLTLTLRAPLDANSAGMGRFKGRYRPRTND